MRALANTATFLPTDHLKKAPTFLRSMAQNADYQANMLWQASSDVFFDNDFIMPVCPDTLCVRAVKLKRHLRPSNRMLHGAQV